MDDEAILEPGDGWILAVPAGLDHDREPEDGSLVLWDDTRTLRVSTITTAGTADGSPLSAEEMLGDRAGAARPNAHGVLVHVGPEGVEENYRAFQVRAADTNTLMLVSLYTLEEGDAPLDRLVAGIARRSP